jgi:hypothetical protein
MRKITQDDKENRVIPIHDDQTDSDQIVNRLIQTDTPLKVI